jgi:hypothetical protein
MVGACERLWSRISDKRAIKRQHAQQQAQWRTVPAPAATREVALRIQITFGKVWRFMARGRVLGNNQQPIPRFLRGNGRSKLSVWQDLRMFKTVRYLNRYARWRYPPVANIVAFDFRDRTVCYLFDVLLIAEQDRS